MSKPNIYFWKADNGGCGHYRMQEISDTLQVQGLANTIGSTRLYVDRPYEIIVGQRVTGDSQSKLWQQICESKTTAVFEIDDDLFNIDPANSIAYGYYAEPDTRRQLAKNLAASDLITVTTEYLAGRMREYTDAPIKVLPNCVDLRSLSKRTESNDPLVVGWAGSASHKGDLKAVGPALRRALNKADVKFEMVGADYTDLVRADNMEYRGGSETVRGFYQFLTFDIGIAPIEDIEFNLSKSPLKALEYGARGIPTIASDVGPYRDYIEHGVDGFLVKYDHEWSKYIRLLASDTTLRNTMGEAARKKAEGFDINVRAGEWLDAYKTCT